MIIKTNLLTFFKHTNDNIHDYNHEKYQNPVQTLWEENVIMIELIEKLIKANSSSFSWVLCNLCFD